MTSRTNNKKSGFATLVAILMTSVMLAIGIAIINITVKEILLASSTRDSTRAFFAADSGIECALYWNELGAFATSNQSILPQTIDCGGDSYTINGTDFANSFRADTSFQIDTGDICFSVEVYKDTSIPQTIIESRGYNNCNPSDPRRVERGVRAQFSEA